LLHTLNRYIHVHLYSPVALINYDCKPLERYEYDAYGNCRIMDASYNPLSTSNYPNPYLCTASRLDILDYGSFKLQYNRNRYYDQYTGRWFTHDLIGYIGSMNLYEAFESNPLVHLDPWGLLPVERREDMIRRGILPPDPPGWSPPPGVVCGPLVWAYTGSFCATKEIYDAAVDAAAESIIGTTKCYADCQTKVHHTACDGAVVVAAFIYTHVEIRKAKEFLSQGLPGKKFVTTLQSRLAKSLRDLSMYPICDKLHRAVRLSERSVKAAKHAGTAAQVKVAFIVAFKAVAVAETTIHVYCLSKYTTGVLGVPIPKLPLPKELPPKPWF